jgi:hypothetical protein
MTGRKGRGEQSHQHFHLLESELTFPFSSIPDLPSHSVAPLMDLRADHVPRNNAPDSESIEIDSAEVLAESTALDNYFQHGFRQRVGADEAEESEDDEQEELEVRDAEFEEDSQLVNNTKTRPALAWADKFILETRRKGGRQTESSVLKLWMVCWEIFLRSPLILYFV